MGLLNKIKSALGMGQSGSARSGGDADARVERGPSSGSEDAVKGTTTSGSLEDDELGLEESASGSATDSGDTTEDEWFDEDADADDAIEEAESASTDTSTDAGATASSAESADDGTDADSSGSGSLEDVVPEDDGGASDAAPDTGAGEPVTEVSGIGPAYGERLEAAGVATVGDLATADAATLSDETDIAQGRIETWIESAQNF